jgi:hypothetical protein
LSACSHTASPACGAARARMSTSSRSRARLATSAQLPRQAPRALYALAGGSAPYAGVPHRQVVLTIPKRQRPGVSIADRSSAISRVSRTPSPPRSAR